MGDAVIQVSAWRQVEVGRVVLVNQGEYKHRLAAIVEIIDHKRVLVDGPAADAVVPRQSIPLDHVQLTPIVLSKLPRGSRTGTVKKQWEAQNISEEFGKSAWSQKMGRKVRRRALTDFERFKVMRLRKQARFEVRKSLAKVKAAEK